MNAREECGRRIRREGSYLGQLKGGESHRNRLGKERNETTLVDRVVDDLGL
jgi:hypothetical protein